MKAIVRQSYLDKIEKYLGKDTIIIIVGQRRVGKSYTLRLFRDKVAKDAQANIIFIDKEKHEFHDIQTDQDLNTYIDERRDKTKTNYVLIDEVQDIEGFENSIRSYYEEPDMEIIVTGSNSNMLSSDLANKIGGRYKKIYVQALSYEEFMEFHGLSDGDDTLAKYIQFGGLPGLTKMGFDEQDAREYQMDVYNTVLFKDVVRRNNISATSPFSKTLSTFSPTMQGRSSLPTALPSICGHREKASPPRRLSITSNISVMHT